MPVTEVCRKMGISERTFYRWKKRFQGMGVAEVRRLRPGFAAGGATPFVAAERALVAARAQRACGQVYSGGVEGVLHVLEPLLPTCIAFRHSIPVVNVMLGSGGICCLHRYCSALRTPAMTLSLSGRQYCSMTGL